MNTVTAESARQPGRERLPDRRPADTVEVSYGGKVYAVAIGYYRDCWPGEIFLSGVTTGSDTDGLLADVGDLMLPVRRSALI